MAMQYAPTRPLLAAVVAGAMLLGIAGCGDRQSPAPEAAAPVAGQQPETVPPAETPTEAAAEAETAVDERAAELAAREEELAARERELAEREAAAAAKAAAPAKTAATPKPAAKEPAPAAAAPPPPPPPPVNVPQGTQLSVKLGSGYSTKTSSVGTPVEAQLAEDLVVGDRRVASAGATLRGSITEVTSGSDKVGAVPALKIDFTQLVVADGSTASINARISVKGPSEKGRDTAKIVGGTAAGAIIGHQIDGKSGKIIGGVVGGAAGTAAAKKTGTEAEIAAGSVLTATLRAPFEYAGR
jgi:hypothetical protein